MTDPIGEIKKIYFSTTRGTIVRDFDRAIDLLKTLATEEERERVTVYMQGLAEMKKEWAGKSPPRLPEGSPRRTRSPRR